MGQKQKGLRASGWTLTRDNSDESGKEWGHFYSRRVKQWPKENPKTNQRKNMCKLMAGELCQGGAPSCLTPKLGCVW